MSADWFVVLWVEFLCIHGRASCRDVGFVICYQFSHGISTERSQSTRKSWQVGLSRSPRAAGRTRSRGLSMGLCSHAAPASASPLAFRTAAPHGPSLSLASGLGLCCSARPLFFFLCLSRGPSSDVSVLSAARCGWHPHSILPTVARTSFPHGPGL